jgi:oligopeptide transport system substrate-binding protein
MRNLTRRGFVLRSLALAAAASGGCGGTSAGGPRGNILRLAYATDHRSLDPAIANDMNVIPLLRLIHQTLLDFDDAGINLVPLLAEALPEVSADRCTYTFRIRQGIRFSTGREVTAKDFVTAWERILDPKTKSPNTEYLNGLVGAKDFQEGKADHVEGLTAPNNSTLKATLEKPDHNFPFVTAMLLTAPLPAEEIEARGANFFRRPVGAGPYLVEEWRRSMRLVLGRNPHYTTGPAPGPDGITVLLGYDIPTQLMMFERGELDSVTDIPSADFGRLRKDPHWGPLLTPLTESSTYFLILNCELEPFTDRRIRQAIAWAVDRERIIRLLNGRAIVARGPVPPLMPGYNPQLRGYDHDPDKARRLLAEAGHANDLHLTLWVPTNEPDRVKIAQSVQQDLREVGIEVTLNPTAYEIFLPTTGKRHEVPFSLFGWFQDYPDPSTFLDMLYSGERITEVECNNMSFFNDPAINELIEQAKKEDPPRRYELFRQVEQRVLDECPNVYLYHPIRYYIHQSWVKGAKMDPIWLTRYDRYVLERS